MNERAWEGKTETGSKKGTVGGEDGRETKERKGEQKGKRRRTQTGYMGGKTLKKTRSRGKI